MHQVVRFAKDDEAADRSWLAANPTGHVINERSQGKHLFLRLAQSAAGVNQPGNTHTSSRALSAKISGADRADVEAYCPKHLKRRSTCARIAFEERE